MSQPSAEEFLGSNKVKSAMFGKVQKGGSPVAGTIEHGLIVDMPETMQRRKYAPNKPDDGALMFWDDGKPQWQLVVKIQTDYRDPADPDDDGVRAIYVFGQLKAEVVKAIKVAGAKTLLPGGHLWVRFVEQIINGDGFRQNIFAVKYEAPQIKAQEQFWGPEGGRPTEQPAQPDQSAPVAATSMFEKLKAQGEAGAAYVAGNAPNSKANFQDEEPPF